MAGSVADGMVALGVRPLCPPAGGGAQRRLELSGEAPFPLACHLVDEGDHWFARESFLRAVAAYRQAADSAPSDPLAAIALAHGLFACGDYEQAAAHLHRALTLAPGIAHAQYHLATLYTRRTTFDAHVERLVRYVGGHPGDMSARFVLGYVAFATWQYGQAESLLAAARATFPQAAVLAREAAKRRHP